MSLRWFCVHGVQFLVTGPRGQGLSWCLGLHRAQTRLQSPALVGPLSPCPLSEGEITSALTSVYCRAVSFPTQELVLKTRRACAWCFLPELYVSCFYVSVRVEGTCTTPLLMDSLSQPWESGKGVPSSYHRYPVCTAGRSQLRELASSFIPASPAV